MKRQTADQDKAFSIQQKILIHNIQKHLEINCQKQLPIYLIDRRMNSCQFTKENIPWQISYEKLNVITYQ